MTRASLGHTGRELKASAPTVLIYCSLLVAALSRICAAVDPALGPLLLPVAAAAWVAAFAGFGIVYLPVLGLAKAS